jgi:hypothetical protein
VVAEYGLAAARVRAGSEDGEELVEVTLDLEDDDTIVLRSVKPDGAALGSMRLPAQRALCSLRLTRSNTASCQERLEGGLGKFPQAHPRRLLSPRLHDAGGCVRLIYSSLHGFVIFEPVSTQLSFSDRGRRS